MRWHDKIGELRRLSKTSPDLSQMFEAWGPASPEFVRILRDRNPALPEEYLDFLRVTDGLQLDMFLFGGSGDGSPWALAEMSEGWDSDLPTRCFVFGKDPAGDALCIESDGQVTQRSVESTERPWIIADSFGEAMNDVFLGSKHFRLYPGGLSVNNKWLALLRQMGWASE